MTIQEIKMQITNIQLEMNRISDNISNLEMNINNLNSSLEENDYNLELQELSQLKRRLAELNTQIFNLEGLLQEKMNIKPAVLTGVESLGKYNNIKNQGPVLNTASGYGQTNLSNTNLSSTKLAGLELKTKPNTKSDNQWEQNIGKNVMGVLASLLIFIGLCSLGALVFDDMGDVAKAGLIHLISFVLLGIGLWRVKVNKNAFSTSLSAIGIGSVYISIFVDCFLDLLSLPVMGILVGIWSIINLGIAYKYQSILYTTISYIGFFIATTLGMLEYSDIPTIICVLFIMQLLFNCVVLSPKYSSEIKFQNIISYIMIGVQYLTMVRIKWDTPREEYWMVVAGVAVIGYLIYINYSYFKRKVSLHKLSLGGPVEELKGLGDFVGHLYVSLFLYVYNISFIAKALPKEFDYMLSVIAGVGLVVLLMYFVKIKFKELCGSGITVFYYVLSFLSLIYVFDINWDLTNGMIALGVASLFFVLLYVFYNQYKDKHYLHITVSSYVLSAFALWNIIDTTSELNVLVLFAVLAFIIAFCALNIYMMLSNHSIFDKIALLFGFKVGILSVIYNLYDYDVLSIETRYLAVFSLLVLVTGFVTLTGFGTDWNVTKSLFKRIETSKLDATFYLYRVLSYFYMLGILSYMYNITDDLALLLVYTIYATFLCCLNVKHVLNTCKDYSGYLLGFKFTVFSMFMLDILSGDLDIGLLYSIICLVIAVSSILLGFYFTEKSFRLYGLFLSILAVLKLVFVDITYDNSIYRILGYIFGGVLCLGIVFIYNHLESIQDKNNTEG